MTTHRSYLMNGKWQMKAEQENTLQTIVNPFTKETIFTYIEPTQDEVKSAILAAKKALRNPFTPRTRADILLKTSELMKERKEDLARAISMETGKPIRDARLEVGRATLNFRMAAEEAARIQGYTEEQEPLGTKTVISMTIREPVGVVCAITPFNFPMNITALKIAPALAAGNAVVLKPADQTPMSVSMLADLLIEAGLPDGYLTVVLGGPKVGHTLFIDEQIDLYTFTGSVAVGQLLKQQSGIRPVILELGSNAPNIVHEDVNVQEVASQLVKAAFSFAGQVCVSAQRIYVHRKIYDEFLQEFITLVKQLKTGDPLDEQTDIGPMIATKAAIRVEQWVHEAITMGAVSHTEIRREDNVLYPIVLSNVSPSMQVMCEEAFGPIVNVLPYDTVAEVIEQCNDSQFGLQAGVFTNNLHVAMAIARGLDYGSVNLNQTSTARPDSMPYGGRKNSGIGKEGARASIEAMTTQKVITIIHEGAEQQ